MKKLVLIMALFLLTATNVWSSGFLYHSDGPYKGKVVDMETGEPIEGAVVAGLWYLEFTISNPFCDAKETLTDNKGEFILPRASCFTFWPLAGMDREVVVFKPGYLGYPPLGATYEERKARMSGFTGDEFRDKAQYNIIKLGRPKTRQEREFTLNNGEGQFLLDECYEKLPILLKMVNEEGRNLGIGEIGRPEKRRLAR
jgi:hypothetical protein